jgi:hypothetical protein
MKIEEAEGKLVEVEALFKELTLKATEKRHKALKDGAKDG